MNLKCLLLLVLTGLLAACAQTDVHKAPGVHTKGGHIVRVVPISYPPHELGVSYEANSPTKPPVEIEVDGLNRGSLSGTQVKRINVSTGNHTVKFIWTDGAVSRELPISNSEMVYLAHD